ncbi:hypothetical protein J1N35_041108 [Gossypium stocksii]|uniref:Uncharacterized protein n=1 Tax=Gossypium stocksii TaxID=47602 RepID=A0A9D3UF86_9ROSI|nr:hypothetical protein J1N35_041108 [Gossypium stocksii]
MRWLEDNFKTIEASASEVEKEQFARAFILWLIGGFLMLDKSRNLVEQPRKTQQYTDRARGYLTSFRSTNRRGD